MNPKYAVKLVIGVLIIGGALGYLVVNAVQSSWAYDVSVDDFLSDEKTQGHRARVGGMVQKGSIERDLEQLSLLFVLDGRNSSLPVSYRGTIPDNFAEEREILVEGQMNDKNIFQADKVITKCESKYRAKVEK